MFITDLKLVEDKSSPSSLPKNQPRVTWLTDDPPLASVLSEAAYRELQQLIMDVKDIHGNKDLPVIPIPLYLLTCIGTII